MLPIKIKDMTPEQLKEYKRIKQAEARAKKRQDELEAGVEIRPRGGQLGVTRAKVIKVVMPKLDRWRKYATDEERKAAERESNRRYYEANKDKVAEYARRYARENPEVYAESQRRYVAKLKSTPEGRVEVNFKHRKEWAQRNDIEFTIKFEELLPLPTKCPIFDIEIDYHVTDRPTDNSPSIDRIDPKKGYTKGNVQVISRIANSTKGDKNPSEFRAILDSPEDASKDLLTIAEYVTTITNIAA